MAERWEVVLVAEVAEWFVRLVVTDPVTAARVEDAIDLLASHGPSLGRPIVDSVVGSRIHNMKELRPGSTGRSEVRLLFVFDPRRRAVALVAGDKAGDWRGWYATGIPLAEARYAAHLAELDTRSIDDGFAQMAGREGPG